MPVNITPWRSMLIEFCHKTETDTSSCPMNKSGGCVRPSTALTVSHLPFISSTFLCPEAPGGGECVTLSRALNLCQKRAQASPGRARSHGLWDEFPLTVLMVTVPESGPRPRGSHFMVHKVPSLFEEPVNREPLAEDVRGFPGPVGTPCSSGHELEQSAALSPRPCD